MLLSNHLSDSQQHHQAICAVLLAPVTGARGVERATPAEDRRGVDYWVIRKSGRRVGVDVKCRSTDRLRLGTDDVALES